MHAPPHKPKHAVPSPSLPDVVATVSPLPTSRRRRRERVSSFVCWTAGLGRTSGATMTAVMAAVPRPSFGPNEAPPLSEVDRAFRLPLSVQDVAKERLEAEVEGFAVLLERCDNQHCDGQYSEHQKRLMEIVFCNDSEERKEWQFVQGDVEQGNFDLILAFLRSCKHRHNFTSFFDGQWDERVYKEGPKSECRIFYKNDVVENRLCVAVIGTYRQSLKFYDGEQGSARHVRTLFDDGEERLFEGTIGFERLVTARFRDRVRFYEGPKNSERHVRTLFDDGEEWFYEGDKGSERLATRRIRDSVRFYEGPKNSERHVRILFDDGEEWFYEGEKDFERLVTRRMQDKVRFYEGQGGSERRVRTLYADGKEHFFEGEFGSEHIVRIRFNNGDQDFFEGVGESMRRVRTVLSDGTKQVFISEAVLSMWNEKFPQEFPAKTESVVANAPHYAAKSR